MATFLALYSIYSPRKPGFPHLLELYEDDFSRSHRTVRRLNALHTWFFNDSTQWARIPRRMRAGVEWAAATRANQDYRDPLQQLRFTILVDCVAP